MWQISAYFMTNLTVNSVDKWMTMYNFYTFHVALLICKDWLLLKFIKHD